jgi:hypothetical protein
VEGSAAPDGEEALSQLDFNDKVQPDRLALVQGSTQVTRTCGVVPVLVFEDTEV